MRPLTNRNPDRTDPANAEETSLDPAASEPRAPSAVATGDATSADREPAAHGLATDTRGGLLFSRRLLAGLPAALVFAAVVFSLLVARETKPGVFYSGDGGVKFLLVRQLANGELSPDLRLPAPPWADALWKRGLYPHEPPFVYALGERHVSQYPVFFPLLTAPWYRAFGFAGLYVLPLLALWATWATIAWAARRLALGPGATSVALLACSLASPLMLYGAMFWEHTTGVALAFAGLLLPLLAKDERARARVGFAGGALAGLSVWFRSEHVALAAVAVLVFAVAAARKALPRRTVVAWVAGLALAAAGLLAVNAVLYGNPLGAHAFQVLAPRSLPERLRDAVTNLVDMTELLVTHFPFAVLALACAVAALVRSGGPRRTELASILVIAVLYVVAVPLILPRPELGGFGGKQWGPRYLLVVVPLLSVLAGLATSALWRRSPQVVRAAIAAALALCMGLGGYVNSVKGPRALAADYAGRVLPAFERVAGDPSPIVAVGHTFVAQELAALTAEKTMFLTRGWDELGDVATAAREHGVSRFLFVTRAPGLRPAMFRGLGEGDENLVLTLTPVGSYGAYAVHEVSMTRE